MSDPADETRPPLGLLLRACSILALFLGALAALLVIAPYAVHALFATCTSALPLALIGSLIGVPAAAAGGFAWGRLGKDSGSRSYRAACKTGFWLGLAAFAYGACVAVWGFVTGVWALVFGPPI